MSAAGWHENFHDCTDRKQLFDMAELDGRIRAFVWAKPWADTRGYDASARHVVDVDLHDSNIGKRRTEVQPVVHSQV